MAYIVSFGHDIILLGNRYAKKLQNSPKFLINIYKRHYMIQICFKMLQRLLVNFYVINKAMNVFTVVCFQHIFHSLLIIDDQIFRFRFWSNFWDCLCVTLLIYFFKMFLLTVQVLVQLLVSVPLVSYVHISVTVSVLSMDGQMSKIISALKF